MTSVNEQHREQALAAGFDDHFAKPVSTAKLAELLEAVDRESGRSERGRR